jgi:hypothetical protein
MQMPEPKRMLLFILRFVVLFGLLVGPWPGFREQFARGLQTELRAFFHVLLPPGQAFEVRYVDRSTYKAGDTEIWKLPAAAKKQGDQMTATTLVCDSRSLGWMPHAMILALCAATPLRWRKRWKVALTGLLATHLLVLATFIAGFFSTYANEISNSLVRWLVIGADHILVDNLWVSFVGPFLMWIVALVVFDRSDEPMFSSGTELAGKKRSARMRQLAAHGLAVTVVLWAGRAPAQTPPAISAQPQNQMLLRGSNATFVVSATGTEPTYQWYWNGTQAIASATDTQLTLTNVQPAQAGNYSVVITNSWGAVTSAPAQLTVLVVPTGPVNPYAAGTLGYDLFAGTHSLAGATNRTASYNINAADLGTNTQVWTWPVNLSCVGHASDGYQSVLIAPDKLLSCAHFGGESGQTVTFHDTNGISWTGVVTNTTAAIADMVIAQLSNAAPASIVIPYVLPPDYTNYIAGHSLLWMPAFWLHKNTGHIDYAPVVYFADSDLYGYGTWMGLVHSSYGPGGSAGSGGDSGSPAFLLWSNHPVLAFATTLTPDAAGLFVSGLTNWNSLAALGLTNGMNVLDLSGYPLQPSTLNNPDYGNNYLVPPTNQVAALGSPVTLTVEIGVFGGSSMSYQWQFNGTNIPGATASWLSINVAPATVGSYSVIVSNDLGCLTSAPAFVRASTSAPPDSVADAPLPAWVLALIALGLSALGANALRSKTSV